MNKVNEELEKKLDQLKETVEIANLEEFNQQFLEIKAWLNELPELDKKMIYPIAMEEIRKIVAWLKDKMEFYEDIRLDQNSKNHANHKYNQY